MVGEGVRRSGRPKKESAAEEESGPNPASYKVEKFCPRFCRTCLNKNVEDVHGGHQMSTPFVERAMSNT